MRSPEFRKHTGFIKRRTHDSQEDGSEEQLSSYRLYDRPINNPERYVYPSLARQYSLGNANFHSRGSPSEDKSSDFDEFEMNSSLSSQVRPQNPLQQPPTESSFSLSPYENDNSSGEEETQKPSLRRPLPNHDKKTPAYNYLRGPIREETSQDNPSVEDSHRFTNEREEPARKTIEIKQPLVKQAQVGRKKKQLSESSSESSDNFESTNNRPSDGKSHPLGAFPRNRFVKGSSLKKTKERHCLEEPPKSSGSSSSFSLDSFDDSPPKTKPIVQKKKDVSPVAQSEHRDPSFQDRFVRNRANQRNDKTATFSRPEDFKQKQAGADKKVTDKALERQQPSSEEELITEYDTKDFKGGSIRAEILNSYYNKQRELTQQQSKSQGLLANQSRSPPQTGKPSANPVQPKKRNEPARDESSDFNSEDEYSPKKHKAQAFEVDVKAKLTLAQAFEARCHKLRERLEVEREEFRHGNIARIYKQMREQQLMQENDLNHNNLQRQGERPNRKIDRLVQGAKPTVNRKEMYKLTKKRYRQLPEVRHRLNEQKRRQDFARRMQNVKKLDREVRLRLKYSNRA